MKFFMKSKQSKVRNYLGHLQALNKLFRLNISILIPGIATLISLIATVVTAIMGQNDFFPLLITIITSCITIISLLFNLLSSVSRQKKMIVYSYSNEDINLFFDEPVSKSNYLLLKNNKSRLMYKEEENDFVRLNIMHLPFSFNRGSYSIPSDVSRNAYRIFSDYLKGKKYFFDSKKIRMDLGVDELMLLASDKRIVQLSKTTYFNSICSNEITCKELRYRDDSSYCFDGYTLVKTKGDKNKNSRIFSLSDSPCSNHIGVSTLAISNDNQVVFLQQGSKNLVGTNKYIVSASGSVEYSDRRNCTFFGDIIVKAMERELREECNLEAKDIIETNVIGFGRLLDRGGKPEFFGISKVNLTVNEIISRIYCGKEKKKEYVGECLCVPCSYYEIAKEIDELANKKLITVQLLYYSILLKDFDFHC